MKALIISKKCSKRFVGKSETNFQNLLKMIADSGLEKLQKDGLPTSKN